MLVGELLELLGEEEISPETKVVMLYEGDNSNLEIETSDIHNIVLQPKKKGQPFTIKMILTLLIEGVIVGSTDIQFLTEVDECEDTEVYKITEEVLTLTIQ